MIYDLYPAALERGIPVDVFWGSSVPDVLDLLNAAERKAARELKERAALQFVHADAVATRIGYLFTDTKKRKKESLLMPWDVYPRLFAEEKEEENTAEKDAALLQHKEQMAAYAAKWNAYRKKKT